MLKLIKVIGDIIYANVMQCFLQFEVQRRYEENQHWMHDHIMIQYKPISLLFHIHKMGLVLSIVTRHVAV